jgi:phosphoglucomutase
MEVSPCAAKPAEASMRVNVLRLVTAYYTEAPDPSVPEQRVAFGTSGHRGSAFERAFNEWHILAISQAICRYRKQRGIDGPLFLGIDTHALSVPDGASALEVLAANGVEVMIAENDEYTPTPAVSHAILTYNRGRDKGLADGNVITPSHNPPHDGGFKYNPSNGGPADTGVTDWIEAKANELLESDLQGVKKIPFEKALRAATTHRHDYLNAYVSDLGRVLDMEAIHGASIRMGVDPLGGAGVHYWARIAERYGLNLTVVNDAVNPTFRFMTVDWDGQIRMDPSSAYAMQRLIGMKDRFDLSFACDTDHDRHGIVTRSAGLMPPNHYLSVAIFYLLQHRPKWSKAAAVGKTVVSSQMIDHVTAKLGRKLYDRVEAPATPGQKAILENLSPQPVQIKNMAGEKIKIILTTAPGNGAPIGGLKVVADSGWFAARPSGTEDIYKIYAESFRGPEHLRRILKEAQTIVSNALTGPPEV